MMRKLIAALIGAGALLAGPALGDEWKPTERLVMVSPTTAGTGADQILREVIGIIEKYKWLDQPINLENVAGAQHENARRYVSTENAGNEHMMLVYTPSTLNNAILSGSQYSWDKFTPIALLTTSPSVVTVNASSPFKTFEDLINAAKEKPGSIVQGGGGFGSSASLLGKEISDIAGVQLPYTPFPGGGEAVTMLLGNHVSLIIESPGEISQYLEAGQLRVLATTAPLDKFPDTPALSKLGYNVTIPDGFRIMMAPPGVSEESAAFWADLMEKVTSTDEWKAYLDKNALSDDFKKGEDLRNYVKAAWDTYRNFDEQTGLLKK
jgi:putative tricarboxylic transport membrane protein